MECLLISIITWTTAILDFGLKTVRAKKLNQLNCIFLTLIYLKRERFNKKLPHIYIR